MRHATPVVEEPCAKGAAGLRPCLQCKSVVLDQAECLADYDTMVTSCLSGALTRRALTRCRQT
eukprot:967612-Pyramimonas_sp.AAC.1